MTSTRHRPARHAPLLATIALLATAIVAPACDGNGDGGAPPEQATPAEQTAPHTGSAEAGQADDTPVVPPPEPQRVAMTSGRATLAAKAPLDIEHLLPREYAGKLINGSMEVVPLPGRKPDPTYNAMQLRPESKEAVYGIGVQIWQFDAVGAANDHVATLEKQYLGTSPLPDSTGKKTGFRSERAGIRTYLFAADNSPHVVALSCATQVCTSWGVIYKLGSDVEEKL